MSLFALEFSVVAVILKFCLHKTAEGILVDLTYAEARML